VDEDTDIGRMNEEISVANPDLVEYRLDKVQDLNVLKRLSDSKEFPAIATDKSKRGQNASSKLLVEAAREGFEFVDVDITYPNVKQTVESIKHLGREVIVSFHDYIGTPAYAELGRILDSSSQMGADICKIVTTATDRDDNLSVLGFIAEKSRRSRLVSFAMGRLGIPSRVLSPLFGAEFTFASMNDESKTAEGQLSIRDLRQAWRLLGIL